MKPDVMIHFKDFTVAYFCGCLVKRDVLPFHRDSLVRDLWPHVYTAIFYTPEGCDDSHDLFLSAAGQWAL